jgi:hypothetical protein
MKKETYNFDNIFSELEDIRVRKNMDIIDENFKELAEYISRDLTKYEEDAILDIVDKYTPKDDKGNYVVDILPFDYAWAIYEFERDVKWKKIKKIIKK